MVTKEQIERINELYRKKKETGLTEEETKEQEHLRRLYIDSFKENLRSQLEGIEYVSPDKQEELKLQKKHEHGEGCNCGCHKPKKINKRLN